MSTMAYDTTAPRLLQPVWFTGLVAVSATIVSFSSSVKRRRVSATKTRFSSLGPDIGTAIGLIVTNRHSRTGHPQHRLPPRKASLTGRLHTTGRLDEMKVPTLVINGEFDRSLSAGQRTASLIPGAMHKILPGAGHACCIEDPAGFDRLVIDFLQSRGLMPEL